MAVDIDAIVVGGGVVGLAAARALANAGREVAVIERHRRCGEEISSRNSQVLHAGLYYAPGSLKARLCREGARQLLAFAGEHGVPVDPCGKLIVATQADEDLRLAALEANARATGAQDLQRLTAAQVSAMEPQLLATSALWSPHTAVIDSRALLDALQTDLIARGGSVALNTTVTAIAWDNAAFRITMRTAGSSTTVTARRLVLSGGLSASELSRMLSFPSSYAVPETRFAKGHYFALKGPQPFQRLIYPLPVPGGLGIHYTPAVDGTAKFGPDVDWCDAPSYAFEDADARLEAFVANIRRYWPAADAARLMPDMVGVRPKLHKAGEGTADFAVHGPDEHGIAGLVALYGIESPGLTASLALGQLAARTAMGA